MADKEYFVKEPAEAAIPIVAALIAAGFIPYDADEIGKAHKIISRALDKPKGKPMKISSDLLSKANEKT
jgi:hypothetical protein